MSRYSKNAFIPLEKAADSIRRPADFRADGSLTLPSAQLDSLVRDKFLNGVRRRSSLTGFTLIELLIALSIFAVVAVTMYSTFFAGVSAWRRFGEDGGGYEQTRNVFDDIERDLKNALYFTKDAESDYAFAGASGEIVFMTLEEYAGADMESGREVVKVSYYFDAEKNEFVKKRADISMGFNIEKAEEEVLLSGVSDFRIEYCYDSGDEGDPYSWREEWKDGDARLPRGVRVKSAIKKINSKSGDHSITRVVFVPDGVLGKKEL